MSKITIIGGNLIETIGGSNKIYAKEGYEIHSNKQIIQNGKEGVSFGMPEDAPVVARISTNCMVEFRTKQDGTYTGQFGFDWLRVDDSPVTHEAKYYDCLVNGYEAPNGRAPHRDANTQYENKDEAYKALKKEYKNIPVRVPVTTPASPPRDYFVPYLNLFSKPYSDATVIPTGMPKPPFEAELRTLIEVGGTDEPDQVRVVFDKRYFEINGSNGDDANPVLLDKTTGAKRNGATILIKCIADFDSYQEIKVYNYPKGTLARPLPEQLAKRELAGKIIVGANKNGTRQGAVKNVKKQKFVFVNVRTNVSGIEKTGSFNSNDKQNLQNALHQGLVHGEFEDCLNDLDIRTNLDYKIGGQFVNALGLMNEDAPNFFSTLRTIFLNERNPAGGLINTAYRNYFIIFTMNEGTYDNTPGQVEGIGKKCVVLFDGRYVSTCAHEGLHGLGLYHSHDDRNAAAIALQTLEVNRKFIYTRGTTTNFMSYNVASRESTWKWQWKIMKSNTN